MASLITGKTRAEHRAARAKAKAKKAKKYDTKNPHNLTNVANAIKSRKAAYEKELAKMGK